MTIETDDTTTDVAMPSVNPEMLIAKALERNVPIEVLEKLLAMRRELRAEWARERYFTELAAFQSEIPTIKKTKAVKQGDAVRYHYAPMDSIVEQVKTPLFNHGFSYRVELVQTPEEVTANMVITHKDGHSETTPVTVPVKTDNFMSNIQHVGEAIMYAKRYAFCNGLGIMTGDEDTDGKGEQKSGKTEGARVAPPPRKRPADQQEVINDIFKVIDAKGINGDARVDWVAKMAQAKTVEALVAVKAELAGVA